MNSDHKTNQGLVRKFNVTESDDLPRRPKRRVTTRQQDRYICTCLTHLRDRNVTASATERHTLGSHGRPLSGQTVRNRLRDGGLCVRRPYVGLVLSARHRQHRLACQNVIYVYTYRLGSSSDESRVNLRNRIYRRMGERYNDACVREQGGNLVGAQ